MESHLLNALSNVLQKGIVPVIVDIKRISPKDGILLQDGMELTYIDQLDKAGVPAYSVVTEEENFGGSLALLKAIAGKTNRPILRKDFITTEDQLKESLDAGASAVLLISGIMDFPTLALLYEKCFQLGLEPFVETHDAIEIQNALKLSPATLGINNKNILDLEKDDGTVRTTEDLLANIPDTAIVISESGIRGSEDIQRVVKAGASGVLVGTAVWQSDNPAAFYRSLCVRRPYGTC